MEQQCNEDGDRNLSKLCNKILYLLVTFLYLFHPYFSNASQLSLTLENEKSSYSHAITSENPCLHSETTATLLVLTATRTGTVCNVTPRSAEMQTMPAMPECASQGRCSSWDPKAVRGEDAEKQLNSLAWGAVCAQSSLPATTTAEQAGSLAASSLAWPGSGAFLLHRRIGQQGSFSPFRRGQPHPLSPAGGDRSHSLCVREDTFSLT